MKFTLVVTALVAIAIAAPTATKYEERDKISNLRKHPFHNTPNPPGTHSGPQGGRVRRGNPLEESR